MPLADADERLPLALSPLAAARLRFSRAEDAVAAAVREHDAARRDLQALEVAETARKHAAASPPAQHVDR